MSQPASRPAIAFEGFRRIAAGPLGEVAAATRRAMDDGANGAILLFDAASGELIDLDWRGSASAVVKRLVHDAPASGGEAPADAPRGRGRPRLGVVPREVTLLPRHWEWLAAQPGGASVALRKLVEEARKVNAAFDAARQSRDAAYRFMSAIGSGLAGFEEASRALFAGAPQGFASQVAAWPADVRVHVLALASAWFAFSEQDDRAPQASPT